MTMNIYDITIEEVVVHHAAVGADSPRDAFDLIRSLYEDGEFDEPGESQETRIAVRSASGETLLDFEKI